MHSFVLIATTVCNILISLSYIQPIGNLWATAQPKPWNNQRRRVNVIRVDRIRTVAILVIGHLQGIGDASFGLAGKQGPHKERRQAGQCQSSPRPHHGQPRGFFRRGFHQGRRIQHENSQPQDKVSKPIGVLTNAPQAHIAKGTRRIALFEYPLLIVGHRFHNPPHRKHAEAQAIGERRSTMLQIGRSQSVRQRRDNAPQGRNEPKPKRPRSRGQSRGQSTIVLHLQGPVK